METGPRALLQVIQTSGSGMFILRFRTLSLSARVSIYEIQDCKTVQQGKRTLVSLVTYFESPQPLSHEFV